MTITKRGDKGSALTYNEMDENIRDLFEDTDLNRVITNGNTAGNTVITTDSISVGDTTGSNFNVITKEPVAHRNLLINGGMNVWQRGTSSTFTNGGYKTVDRWTVRLSSLGEWTQTRSTDVPSGQGFSYSLKSECITADANPSNGDYFRIEQRIEGQNLQHIMKGTPSAKKLTLSFWVKSNKTGTYNCQFQEDSNNRNVSAPYTINSSDTWEKKTITFPADTTGTIDNDNTSGLNLRFWLGAGGAYNNSQFDSPSQDTWVSSSGNFNDANDNVNLADSIGNEWYLTGVQLEVGDVATGFEFEPYETTYLKCLRYNYRIESTVVGHAIFIASGVVNSTTESFGPVQMVHPLRASPTVTYSDLNHFEQERRDVTPTKIDIFTGNSSGLSPSLYWQHAALTAGEGSVLILEAIGWINFDAEL